MLRPFAHPVACCWMLFRVVAQSLKGVKLSAPCKRTQHCWLTCNSQNCWELLRPFARCLKQIRSWLVSFQNLNIDDDTISFEVQLVYDYTLKHIYIFIKFPPRLALVNFPQKRLVSENKRSQQSNKVQTI